MKLTNKIVNTEIKLIDWLSKAHSRKPTDSILKPEMESLKPTLCLALLVALIRILKYRIICPFSLIFISKIKCNKQKRLCFIRSYTTLTLIEYY